jgi:putative ABC transport system substrate-binding protein
MRTKAAFLAAYFVASIVTLIFAYPTMAQQTRKVPVIGFLLGSSERVHGIHVDRLRQSLKEAGYVDGRDIVLEYRFARGKPKLAREQAAEFVQRGVDVIVTVGRPPTRAAAKATKTIPIVVAFASDLIQTGLIGNMARPKGNVTGMTALTSELAAKRLQLLTEAIPGISRVALLLSPTKSSLSSAAATKLSARNLGLTLQEVHVRGPSDFADAFLAIAQQRSEAVIMVAGRVISTNQRQLIKLAVERKLPTICWRRGVVRAGCLMSYGADRSDMVNRAAEYVAKILQGAKPADLPVQRPAKIEIAINLQTAKALGITIPPLIWVRATKVIE